MTRRRNLEHHRNSLVEIRNIMNSMKTLAYLELRKITRFLEAQNGVIQTIEEVAHDLLSFHPEILPETIETEAVYIVIGTERGFCGDFNHALLQHLETSLQVHLSSSPMLIAIGRKFYTMLEGDPRLVVFIDGASVVEEVTSLLNQVVNELTTLQEKHGVLTVYCLYHAKAEGLVMQKLLPSFQSFLHEPSHFPYPPVLNLSPKDLLVSLSEHYLFATLHEILYTSLMVENHYRVKHLEGAVKRLDEQSTELSRQCNILRQEEIIEEIEVILLSTSNLKEPEKSHLQSVQDQK
jgi:F-type H+-transporting ATPase subunit gamma